MKITELFTPTRAKADIADGYVRVHQHPSHPDLVLLNYTEKAQFDNHWTPVTLNSRGLVYDQLTMDVVARPFPKFFNYDQHAPDNQFGPLPDEPFDVYDKFDGSLGIFFFHTGGWHTATRGSFASEQAQWARRWLHDGRDLSQLDPNVTYLAEIIYPENRVVVDYRGLKDCVLLGGYDLTTGWEVPLSDLKPAWPGSAARRLNGWATLHGLIHDANNADVKGTQREGFVIRFVHSGLRAKIKYADYKRVHGFFTETNEKTIWSVLASGQGLNDLLAVVPDELYAWCRSIQDDLNQKHSELVASVIDAHKAVMATFDEVEPYTRKGYALTLKSFVANKTVDPKIVKAVFLALDNNSEKLSNWAWRQLEPKFGGRRPDGRASSPDE